MFNLYLLIFIASSKIITENKNVKTWKSENCDNLVYYSKAYAFGFEYQFSGLTWDIYFHFMI